MKPFAFAITTLGFVLSTTSASAHAVLVTPTPLTSDAVSSVPMGSRRQQELHHRGERATAEKSCATVAPRAPDGSPRILQVAT